MDKAPDGPPGEILDSAKETLAAALPYAQEISGEIGAALCTAATDAFTSALATTSEIAAAILAAVGIFAGAPLRGV